MYKRVPEQIEDLVVQLRSADSRKRKDAAERIRELGLYSQKSLDPRGTFTKAAEERLREGLIEAITKAIQDRDVKVKTALAAAVGEWGGETSIPKLLEEVPGRNQKTNKEHAYAVVSALRNIGGPDASRALAEVSVQKKINEGIRLAAISALEEIIWSDKKRNDSQGVNTLSLANEIIQILGKSANEEVTNMSQLTIKQRINDVIEILEQEYTKEAKQIMECSY